MKTSVTLTKNYTLSFPKETKQELKKHGFKAGQEFSIFILNELLYIVPIVDDVRKLRGTINGIDSSVERNEGDRV